MVKIDYIRVPGIEWMDDPHERFVSPLDDPQAACCWRCDLAEASIIDELPKGFHLPEGELHSVQEPLVPRKVIREALANAVMHRSYTQHSPIQIIRYSNRIEIRNVGHSLKPVAELGIPGSRLRNPTHGRRAARPEPGRSQRHRHPQHAQAGRRGGTDAARVSLQPRVGTSSASSLFLHNLLTEDDHAWLQAR
jgi:ATP-dependent DNA helicase RecG